MKINKTPVAILGDGGWGTTLAVLLSKKGYKITLWSAFEHYAKILQTKRINTKFLPGIRIPDSVRITHDLRQALSDQKVIILAVPSVYMREVLRLCVESGYSKDSLYLNVSKGIEIKTLKRMSEVIKEELGAIGLAILSGPTIAHEVARGIPTTAVIASKDSGIRKSLQDICMTDRFRVYTNSDIIGVELGGSLKNVIALACGISDGLGFGTNTKAALLSRGLAEISRLGLRMGACAKTFSGLSGLGDLVTTCISPYSRNRFVGEQIGKGKSLKYITSRMQMVAEGIPTTRSAYELSARYSIDTPIIREVYLVLYKNKSPLKAVRDLMTREKKDEGE